MGVLYRVWVMYSNGIYILEIVKSKQTISIHTANPINIVHKKQYLQSLEFHKFAIKTKAIISELKQVVE